MQIGKWENSERYNKQSDLIRQALAALDHSLEALLQSMRSSGEAALYLSGGRLDNDFCFGSGDLGLLLSVLPEDGAKAGEPGYHPGSAEVYVTFQGSLTLQRLQDGQVEEKIASHNEVVVLPPGQCHRVRNGTQSRAASLIAKTNLHHKPGVIRCANCTYFANPADCALHRAWKAETDVTGV